ncbi:MAG: hypothetical protein WBA54_04910 [Acidaminobacteraceae bacterium]
MKKKLTAKMENGMDMTLKVLSTLRRKEYDIEDFQMTCDALDENAFITITLRDDEISSIERAMYQMEKIHGISDIQIN